VELTADEWLEHEAWVRENSPKREPVVREQPVDLPTELTTADEFEVGLLLHYRRLPHLGKQCSLCLIEFDRNGFQRKYVNAVVSEDAASERYDDVVAVLSYVSVVDINPVLSYLSYEVLISIFAGVGD
jgi:hypothetical protein